MMYKLYFHIIIHALFSIWKHQDRSCFEFNNYILVLIYLKYSLYIIFYIYIYIYIGYNYYNFSFSLQIRILLKLLLAYRGGLCPRQLCQEHCLYVILCVFLSFYLFSCPSCIYLAGPYTYPYITKTIPSDALSIFIVLLITLPVLIGKYFFFLLIIIMFFLATDVNFSIKYGEV